MNSDNYDVIVVGAGPAGGQCAREVAQAGHTVLLIERSQQIGQPNFSSGGVPKYLLEEFNLPQSVVADYWDGFQIVGPTTEYTWDYNGPGGYVLKFDELKKFLVIDGIQHNLQVMVGTSVSEPSIEAGQVVGVKIRGLHQGSVRAKIVVDASGPAGAVASRIGLREPILSSPSIGLEFVLENVHFPRQHVLGFYLGEAWVPHGYGWVFPMGEHQAKVGLAVYEATANGREMTLSDQVKAFIAKINWLKGAQPIEVHGGSIYVTGGIKDLVTDNVLVIGDAAAQINPLGGEGIRHGLRAGRMAAHAIDQALQKDDLGLLSNYERDWHNYIGNKWSITRKLADLGYHKMTNKQFDQCLNLASTVRPQEALDIFFEYDFRVASKIALRNIHKMPSLIAAVIKA